MYAEPKARFFVCGEIDLMARARPLEIDEGDDVPASSCGVGGLVTELRPFDPVCTGSAGFGVSGRPYTCSFSVLIWVPKAAGRVGGGRHMRVAPRVRCSSHRRGFLRLALWSCRGCLQSLARFEAGADVAWATSMLSMVAPESPRDKAFGRTVFSFGRTVDIAGPTNDARCRRCGHPLGPGPTAMGN